MRVYDGETYAASRARNAAAFGPGSGVTTCGTGRWSNWNMGSPALRCASRLSGAAFDVGGQPLGHLDLGPVVDRPRRLVRHRLDQTGRRRVAVAALLHPAER